jgi:hypothetical protein
MSRLKTSNIKFTFSASKLFLLFSITVSVILLCLILWKTNNFARIHQTNNFSSHPMKGVSAANVDKLNNSALKVQRFENGLKVPYI